MLMRTRKGTTTVTQQEKVTNETRQQVISKALLCSILLLSSFWAVFILSQANFYSIHFLKVRHFPGKIDSKQLPGVFLEAVLLVQEIFKKVLRPIFFMARDQS